MVEAVKDSTEFATKFTAVMLLAEVALFIMFVVDCFCKPIMCGDCHL